ncbi:hypothetical protein KBK19_18290 [Microvirga sp. STR05]|uniref:DUF4440 domain-containing protein n=1 Tax=Hymenobacter duratus TaxID=2771356 RepID=A0ABR8JN12_9BACT|nr:hypothetical protein [Hymenobacter duratus]MBD2717001.1 hypothetical protein [Hymenobacter duratus]MBR7951917.1 hypothetical protein [Microvirga sp. STR05]
MPDLLPPALSARRRSRMVGGGLAVGAVLAGCNPFAPGLDDMPTDPNQLLGNPVTVRGFFDRFRSAYQLRDSTLYGQLLDRRFTFTYRDFAANVDRTWNRDVEISTTYKLFRAARTANLQWTQYLPTTDTLFSDTLVYVERSFQLSIEQRDNQQFQGAGSARLVLVRKQKGDPWRMRSWYDRSEF